MRIHIRAGNEPHSHDSIALPDEGLSEYRVQYTHAGQSRGCVSGVGAAVPLSTTSEEDVFSPAPPPVLSSAFTPSLFPVEATVVAVPPPLLFFELAKEVLEDAEDEVLSLLQFESWDSVPGRLGLLNTGWTRSRVDVCALSRAPFSFLQPKSGRKILSIKKLVVLWAC